MRQKIIKVGNSAAITLPKEFLKEIGLRIGDEMTVETNAKLKYVWVKPISSNEKSSLTPEFKEWLDTFMEENRPLLEELSRL